MVYDQASRSQNTSQIDLCSTMGGGGGGAIDPLSSPPRPTALQRYIPCTLERVVAVEMFEIFVTGHYSSLVGKFGDSFGGVANVSCYCMHTKMQKQYQPL